MVINFGEPLTLGELVDKLEPGEGIIAEFPNGEGRHLTRYSRLDYTDAHSPILNTYKYDCNTRTYYVKISTLEMYLSPSKTYHVKVEKKKEDVDEASKAKELVIRSLNSYYGLDPIGHIKDTKEWYWYDGHEIKRIICDGPATIIFWDDGTKTVVKAQEEIDYEKGILYAALKKLATKKEYDNILRAIDKVDEARKDDPIKSIRDNLFPDHTLSPDEVEEFTKAVSKETPKKKREYKYQKCPVCGKGYNLNYYRTSKVSKQGFVDIRCSSCDTLFRVKGDWHLPKWWTKLEHDVLIKGKGGDK